MSERIGAVKTAGRVYVAPLGLPSAVEMPTTGRVVIVVDVDVCNGWRSTLIVEFRC